MDEVGLGRLLQTARKKAGLTQQELCQRSGLSYSTLAKIERGAIKSPSIFTIQSLAAALGTSLNDLMGELSPVGASAKPKKRSKTGVRFIYFDINGCLVRFYHRAFTRIAEDSGKQADIIESAFWHYNDEVCRGDMPLDEFNQVLGEQFGLANFDWPAYYLEAIEPINEMHEVVKWASEHYYVGLLSNIMPTQIDSMIERGLLPDVDYTAIIDSSAVGAIKPESRIYEVAMDKSGVASNEILLVDDSRANIMAAQRIGWRVMWFDDYRPDESAKRVSAALEFE